MAVWIIIAVLLVAVEMHHLAFFAVFAAAGAVAAAVVAAFAPSAYGWQVAVASAVAIIGVVAVRPYVSRAFAHRGEGIVVHGVHGGLVGAQAMTIDEVTAHATGHVYLLGESWLAVTTDGITIAPGTAVQIAAVKGTTLTVKTVTIKENQ